MTEATQISDPKQMYYSCGVEKVGHLVFSQLMVPGVSAKRLIWTNESKHYLAMREIQTTEWRRLSIIYRQTHDGLQSNIIGLENVESKDEHILKLFLYKSW